MKYPIFEYSDNYNAWLDGLQLPQGPSLQSQREWLFYSFLLILGSGYTAFALVAWALGFQAGVLVNALGILAILALGGLRHARVRLAPLVTALLAVTLAQALSITWLTGGIYSATISWLALAALPALLANTQLARILGLAVAWLLILGLYGYALLGGEIAMQIMPKDLIHWHFLMAVVIFGMQLALLYRMNTARNQRLHNMQLNRRNLRQVHQQLKNTQQQKDLFVASVSHELRTPMNAILGLADLIQNEKALNSDVRAKVEDIQKSGEHLLTIINDLLDHAQMEAGRLQVVSEPFNLRETLQNSFQLLKRRAEIKPIQYQLNIDPQVPQWVMGDGHRLTQILVNLLGNAIKFTAQGQIELHCSAQIQSNTEPPMAQLRLSVRDTGMGIPTEQQHRVFQSFSQAHHSIARRFGGNGLGLSIAQGLVHAMGGQIGFESEAGQGSTFWVTLDCRLCDAPMDPTPIEDDVLSNEPVRILIADDNPLNRQIAALQLRRHLPQALLTEAEDGLQAFEAMRHGAQYDVILMDVQMPEMDGLTCARKIRTELPEPQRSTPIIALTAKSDKEELALCLDCGMNECMLKPFNSRLLVKRLLAYVS
ncbi:ATP-binding protein [Limnohabitans sp.]|uniref:ATP-binding protein n=1 Tax=Limnohabitans sp. TaxID=1907725 RepID=UPI003341D409